MEPIYRCFAALYPSRSVPVYIKECRHVVDKMTNNAHFTYLNLPLGAVTHDIDELQDAEQATLDGTPGSIAIRDSALLVVQGDMRHLKSSVQLVADANMTHAREIIESAGMSVATRTKTAKPELAVRQGAAPGDAHVSARAMKGRGTYHWQVGDQLTWTDLPATVISSTLVKGLTPATLRSFRFRTYTKDGFSEWSVPVMYIVR